MRPTLYEDCEKRGDAALLLQWHPERNGTLTPGDVTYGSDRKVWWRCERGHEWQAAVCSRRLGAGCPYCAGKRAWPGDNDLATLRPALAGEWDDEKNAGLRPEAVTPGSRRKVWWRCKAGHEWAASVKSRAEGSGCPLCANRRIVAGANDLASVHPALAAEWHPVNNGALTPDKVAAGSRRKVWWRCEKGHEWIAAISGRVEGRGCPVCGGKRIVPGENDLATLFPELAAQLDGEKNGSLTAQRLSPYSNSKVWWRCEKGHSYAATVASRSGSLSGCPYCAGRKVLAGFNDLATVEPKLAGQWDRELNGSLTPEAVTAGSRRKVWWTCADGHHWRAVIYSRTGPKRCGCPVCAGRYRGRSRSAGVLDSL